MFVANQQDQHTGVGSCLRVLLRSKFKTFFNLVILLYITFRLELIEEHFSKTHSVHGLLLGLTEFWKSVPLLWGNRRGTGDTCPIFDVSTAFDTEILIKRPSVSFGLSGLPLDWITSFLAGLYSCVVLGTSSFLCVLAPFGVPYGSVLAPLLYLLYTSDIGPLLSSYGMLSELYE